jgi:hypothetical protein
MTAGGLVFMLVMCAVCYYGGRVHGSRNRARRIQREIDR